LHSRKWDLNICCGKTDGGGINADIVKHENVPNFILLKDIYNLPFDDKEFEHVLCSHTLEHVENPERFYKELQRIGKNVTIVVPPLWDISASLMNIFQHRWIFLTFGKTYNYLPKYVPLPFAKKVQEKYGRKIVA
jgi:ubiquinone/menaquinone biosynthesis C-methylase UbiE